MICEFHSKKIIIRFCKGFPQWQKTCCYCNRTGCCWQLGTYIFGEIMKGILQCVRVCVQLELCWPTKNDHIPFCQNLYHIMPNLLNIFPFYCYLLFPFVFYCRDLWYGEKSCKIFNKRKKKWDLFQAKDNTIWFDIEIFERFGNDRVM